MASPRSNSISLERDLHSGKQAHRRVRFFHGGKIARERVVGLRPHELVSHLCGSGRQMVQTIVAHQTTLVVD